MTGPGGRGAGGGPRVPPGRAPPAPATAGYLDPVTETALLAGAFFCVAALYGSVGHAGASGYLAVMALAGVAPERMKPTALALNIVVAAIATVNFARAGAFFPRQVLPFALGSVPFALLGGAMPATAPWYRPLLAVVLVVAAARLSFRPAPPAAAAPTPLPFAGAVAIGAAIGLLSGLTGTGGGIFLTPLLVLRGLTTVRQSAGLSASFILLNSIAGLIGSRAAAATATADLLVLAAAAGAGGFAGSWVGANRLPERPLTRLLGVVLLVAAFKLAAT